jgi:dienelactone hydrolase
VRFFQMLRNKRKIAITWFSSFLAIYVGVSTLGAATSMQIPRLPVIGSPGSAGLVFQEVVFNSRVDATSLKGWFIPSSGNSVIVIIHGGFQNRLDSIVNTLDLASDLNQNGYNLLLFDLRGRGESGGHGLSLSNINEDIGGAIDYLNSRGYPSEKIGLLGYCSGAANACIFSSKEKIGGLVLDGCFTSVKDMFYNQASSRGIPRLPVVIFVPGIELAAKVFYHYKEINPIDVVGQVQCPIFFIHEELDDLVSMDDDIALTDASNNRKNILWQVYGTKHSEAYRTHPVEYVVKISEFFKVALTTTEIAQ